MKKIYKIARITIFPSEVENIVQNLKKIIPETSLEFIYSKTEKPYLILFVVKNKSYINKNNIEIKTLIMEEIKKYN